MVEVLKAAAVEATGEASIDVAAVHAEHAGFVWASLHRLGIREADLPDMLQEVFVVVHRRRRSYDRDASSLKTWLYGICARVAANERRRAYRRRERAVSSTSLEAVPSTDPDTEAEVASRRARETATRLLSRLAPERRAVLVMFEVEGLSCPEIAETVGVPVGTVYSRLHAARQDFARALECFGQPDRRTP